MSQDQHEHETPLGLEDDAVGSRIVAEELRLLAVVQRALDAIEAGGAEAAKGRGLDEARLLELRDEVAEAKPEDLPALFEQMHHLGALRAQRGRGAAGGIDRGSPYFGHLRLEENGKRRDVLIGGRSYLDSNAGIRIVDWRNAPVSRLYYRYREEEDYEETLGDRPVEGVVLARRSVAIADGVLVRVAAPQGTYVRGREGRWIRTDAATSTLQTEKKWKKKAGATGAIADGEKARLGLGFDGPIRHDKHLSAIASLLDPTQYDLVSKPGTGLVVIQGSAGSGKTTVGLHRVAYLAFAEPGRFKGDKMLVVVPNEALVHYVGRVLPALGVEGVPVTTFARFASRSVRLAFPKLPSKVSDDTPPVVTRGKQHSAMLRAIDRAVGRAEAKIDRRVSDTMKKWPEGETVVRAWAATVEPGLAVDQRVSVLAGWLAGKRTLAGIPASSVLPDVTRGALERLGHDLRQDSRNVVGIWDELLTNRAGLSETFEGCPGFGPGQLDQMHEWCVRQARIRQEGERDGDVETLDLEDHALLLRVWQRLRGPLLDVENKPVRFAHMFVDEVQDASSIAVRVLFDLTDKNRSLTLAGDMAQRMLDEGDERGEFDWHAMLHDLGVSETSIEPLKVSYRSTGPITRFARGVLGPHAHEAEPIATREGPEVEHFGFASPGEAVAFLADALKDLQTAEPDANVAVIARFGPQADLYFEGLMRAEVTNVRRISQQDFAWEPGVDVTDIRQTKGLEFDEVVLVETNASSYPETSQARHALYVGATRAAHQLWCVSSDVPSKVVTDALDATV
ncbi:MAG: ATP-binding domain-containing protein [Polyangiaceae bacterium]